MIFMCRKQNYIQAEIELKKQTYLFAQMFYITEAIINP